jgi:hypothetical protein
MIYTSLRKTTTISDPICICMNLISYENAYLLKVWEAMRIKYFKYICISRHKCMHILMCMSSYTYIYIYIYTNSHIFVHIINIAKLSSLTGSGSGSLKSSQKNNSERVKSNRRIVNEIHSDKKILNETLQNDSYEEMTRSNRNAIGTFLQFILF